MINTVLFDLDGVLLDTGEGSIDSARYAARIMGFEELPYDTVKKFVGPPIVRSFMMFHGCSEEEATKAAQIFREYYKEKALFKAVLYPGILDTLAILQKNGYKIGVATYKREDYAIRLLEHFGIAPYCDVIHGADAANLLSKKDIVTLCICELKAKPSDVILVGDTFHDAEGAVASGIGFIGVTYGYGFKADKDVKTYPHIGIAENCFQIREIIINNQ